MKRAPIVVWVAMCIAACSGQRILRKDEPFTLRAGEGAVVIGGDTNGEVTLGICRDELHCAQIAPLTTAAPITVAILPAGRWCFVQAILVLSGTSDFTHTFPPKAPSCFDVVEGKTVYP